MRVQRQLATTQVLVLPTTTEYDAIATWLTAGAANLPMGGIQSWSGNRNQRRITFTCVSQTTDFDTAIPFAVT